MELRARQGKPEDLPLLMRLTYAEAAPGSSLATHVKAEWDWLWKSGRFLTTVVTDADREGSSAFMGAILITEEFFQSLARAHHPFCNRRLARCPEPGDRPLPDETGLLDGRATLLIDYLAWDGSASEADAAIVRGYLANAFLDQHGGYPIRRIAVETIGARYLGMSLKTGSVVINDYARWALDQDLGDDDRPYLVAIEREQALQTENHWYTRVFRYQEPKLRLTRAQRELLLMARQGLTDDQISDRLSLGVESIRKRWNGVFTRFYERAPGILTVSGDGKRGLEKRRLVLAYLHERLEELRP